LDQQKKIYVPDVTQYVPSVAQTDIELFLESHWRDTCCHLTEATQRYSGM